MLNWILGFTKLGGVIGKLQSFLDGKKVYIAASAILVPAAATMIQNFAQQGTSYLVGIAGTPEFKAFMEAWAGIAMRAAIAKSTPKPPTE